MSTRTSIEALAERKQARTVVEAWMKAARSASELTSERMTRIQSTFRVSSGQVGTLSLLGPVLCPVLGAVLGRFPVMTSSETG